MFATVLIPPGNILATLHKVKEDLFSELGFASVYALPAFIPILFSAEATRAPASHAIIRQSLPIQTTTLAIVDGLIVVQLDQPTVVEAVARQLSALPPRDDLAPIPAVRALILGAHERIRSAEADEATRSFVASYRSAPLGWRRSDLVCFEFFPGSTKWWENSAIAYLWKRELKGPLNSPEG